MRGGFLLPSKQRIWKTVALRLTVAAAPCSASVAVVRLKLLFGSGIGLLTHARWISDKYSV